MRNRGEEDDPVPDEPEPPPTKPPTSTGQSLTTLMAKYANYDMNGDGIVEIHSLTPAFPNPPPIVSRPKGLVLVFVDPRLIRDDPSSTISGAEMRGWLSLYGNDIDKDGYFPYFVAADVYRGERHQDGRTLLAMRQFLRDVYRNYTLAGTQLIGSFPDAAIVRTVMVRSHPEAPQPWKSGRTTQNMDQLDVTSELITTTGDIVLGDLTGKWENVYRERFDYTDYHLLPSTTAYPVAGQILDTPDYTTGEPQSYADVFVVDDAPPYTVSESGGQVHMTILGVDERNLELAPEDDLEKNRIARPEILVSRLNTLHVAVVPTAPVDLDGKTSPLGPDGKPQSLRYAPGAGDPRQQVQVQWMRSPHLERKLLTDYFARQHSFRLGYDRDKPFRTSAIRQLDSGLRDPGSYNSYLRGAASGFSSSLERDRATLVDYMDWLKQPAVLRGIASHSTEYGSGFGFGDVATLDNAFGGKPWNWFGEYKAGWWVLTPTFKDNPSDAQMPFYRSLWENGVLANAGQFFTIHEGCDVTRVSNSDKPYNDPSYGVSTELGWAPSAKGRVQNAESMLFYANGLALMGRSKIFNDMPQGYVEAVKGWGNFGQGWLAYFHRDATDGDLNELGKPFGADRRTRTFQRKRSYFWNLIGDFTLKLKY